VFYRFAVAADRLTTCLEKAEMSWNRFGEITLNCPGKSCQGKLFIVNVLFEPTQCLAA